ncbi:MAG: type IV pilus twitching motility protein PilT [Alphaproteobacteria bacterium]|nr:MAG: type IV pilus twitching motility protein PilT [Alphaproteobacteria bacterium]
MEITELLKFTLDNKASDLHLAGGNQPIVRIDGDLQRIKTDVLTPDAIRAMLFSVMSEEQRAIYEGELEHDFAISFGADARFRVNAFTNRAGSAAVFRVIPTKIPTMEQLDLPPVMRRLAELEKGLVLVTGPTGSGKSTTLASMINHINTSYPYHILTVEDPVEFFHNSKTALVNHREVGNDTKSFARALKSALREDPDVILVGEMRDHETISLALTAAETGHLVFGTLHSNTASKTIDRIIDVFPAAEKEMVRAMLSSSIQGVIAQTLLKRAGGGRVAAHEIMVGTNAVRNLIRENQLAQLYSMIQTGSRYGMQTMEDSVNDLVVSGSITEQTAHDALKDSAESEDDLPDPAAGAAGAKKGGPLTGAKAVPGKPAPGKPAAIPQQKPGGAAPAAEPAEGEKAEGGYSF